MDFQKSSLQIFYYSKIVSMLHLKKNDFSSSKHDAQKITSINKRYKCL
jgi:hypothetical protein